MAANKGMSVFINNGEEYNINDPNIANEFLTSITYGIGDYVTYQGGIYRFITNHAAGAWNASHVTRVIIGTDVSATKRKADASNYNMYNGWFNSYSAGSGSEVTSAISKDLTGLVTWNNNTPATAEYNYVAVDLGTYGDLKNMPFVFLMEGDASRALRYIFRLSKQASWAPVYVPVKIADVTIEKGERYTGGFVPKDALETMGYSDSDSVFFLVEQATKPGAAVSVNIRLAVNATNAIVARSAVDAEHAGIEHYGEAQIYRSTGMISSIGASVSGVEGEYKVSIPQNSGASGQTYASIGIPMKAFIEKGNKIRFSLKKSDVAVPWNWDAVRLSKSYSNWAPGNLVQLLVQSPGNIKSATYELDLGDYDIDVSQYSDEIYLVFDTIRTDPTASDAVDLTVLFRILTEKTVVATDLEGFIQEDYYTKEEIEDVLDAPQPDADMIFWGDSLTAGAGGSGTTYCEVCANLLGKTHKNCGVGGETEQTIAARQGGNSLMIPAGSVNGNYSFSQMLDYCGKQILPLRQGTGGNTVNPVIINGQECTLSLSDETYTISGYTGTLLCAVPALFNGYKAYGDITVIFVGANGLGSNTVAERISYIRSMLSRIRRKYIVMGISYGNETDRAADDAAMRAEFGNHFFPTRKMLVNYGLAVQGITPTTQDNTDIAAGVVPTSLRSDHIHLNADGYTALGKMLAAFIVGLGYATYPES